MLCYARRAGRSGASLTFWNPDYDKECAAALVRIAREAGQEVPPCMYMHVCMHY